MSILTTRGLGTERPQETTKPEEFVAWYQATCLLFAISDFQLRNYAFSSLSTRLSTSICFHFEQPVYSLIPKLKPGWQGVVSFNFLIQHFHYSNIFTHGGTYGN